LRKQMFKYVVWKKFIEVDNILQSKVLDLL